MSAERPTPKDMPKKRPLLDELGWPSGKAHLEIIDRTTCGCVNCSSIFPVDKNGVNEALNRYAEINLKVHHSNREAGHKTPSQEAEEILKNDTENNR